MRLLVVSNRLPFTLSEKNGKLDFKESVGGLVSGLSAYLDSLKSSSFTKLDYIWIGWPGSTVPEKHQKEVQKRALSEFKSYPVFLSENAMDKFYLGFCNRTIWPLFHYFPTYAVYDEEYWQQYKYVNKVFCDVIMQIIKPGDVLWIQDYQLMLLPNLIRKKKPGISIGFFLHIPFPAFEIFRLLPSKWRTEILEGLLGSDLVGFHTHDYTQYFLRCVLRLLGHDHNMGQIEMPNRMVKADTFPMGIDFPRFYNTVTKDAKVDQERNKLKKIFSGYKIVLSIDRLDYSKGTLNRLQGYEAFLEKNPKWHKKVVLVMVVVPSRIGVLHYQQMKRQIDELVGKINGKFGSMDWTPIAYQYRFLPFHPLIALYSISDVGLVTPLRDGMNLIAKEYVAARMNKKGVLILSEMAGAVKELGEAIIINPNNICEIADALKRALEMSGREQINLNEVMQNKLKRYDVVKWADDFIRSLSSFVEERNKLDANLLSDSVKKKMLKDFTKSKKRLLLLDYDGTMVPFAIHPDMAKPEKDLIRLLKKLGQQSKNDTVIISGRKRAPLQEWFGKLNVTLVSEHGAWVRTKGKDWKKMKPLKKHWKPKLLPILKAYTDRVPGSFIEEKEFSLAWHYRAADPELGSVRAKELMDDLMNFTANIDVQILQGNKILEVRNAGVDKGTIVSELIVAQEYDFILSVGDDWTDEDMFKALPKSAYTIKVGQTSSVARYTLLDYKQVRDLIKDISK